MSTTIGSLIVSGVGTSWLTINRGRGDVISICDQAFPTCTTSTNYVVLGVGSNTQLTLTTPYTGPTGNHGYTIRRQFRGGGNAGQALVLEKRYNTTGSKEDRDLLASKVAEFAAHQRKYFHQEYVDSFYEKDALLEKDDIGRAASFERKKILDKIKELTNA